MPSWLSGQRSTASTLCPLLMGSLGQSGHDGGGPHTSPDPCRAIAFMQTSLASPLGPFHCHLRQRGKRAHKAASRSLAAIS